MCVRIKVTFVDDRHLAEVYNNILDEAFVIAKELLKIWGIDYVEQFRYYIVFMDKDRTVIDVHYDSPGNYYRSVEIPTDTIWSDFRKGYFLRAQRENNNQ